MLRWLSTQHTASRALRPTHRRIMDDLPTAPLPTISTLTKNQEQQGTSSAHSVSDVYEVNRQTAQHGWLELAQEKCRQR